MLEAAAHGDAEALRRLWEENRRWVGAVLLAHKPRQAELEDLLQEVAQVLVARIGEVREAAAFHGWLRTVAANAARTSGRRRRTARNGILARIGLERHNGKAAHAEQGVHERQALEEEGRRLLELASQLPPAYREPLMLRCVRGMSYRQIGEVLDLPETTVENRIVRGRRMLRDLAERTFREGETVVRATGTGVAP